MAEHQEATISNGFSEQFNKQVGADVRFKMEDGRVIYAHRLVLTSRCAFFSKMFDEKWKDTKPFILAEMDEEGVDSEGFYSLLHYIYKGRLDESVLQDRPNLWKRLLALLEISHHYGQMDLFTECKHTLLSQVTVENAVDVFKVANQLNIEDLENHTLRVMAPPNFRKVIQSDAPTDMVKLIAQRLSALGIMDDEGAWNSSAEASELDNRSDTGHHVPPMSE